MKETWRGDPEKYAELAKPFASEDEAKAVTQEFFNAVRKIREQYRIPELCIRFMVYVQGEGGKINGMSGGGGWGDQARQVQMAKDSFDTEFESLVALLRGMVSRLPETHKHFVTDPSADWTEDEE